MRITRLVATTVTAGLIGVTPLAISAPAHADGQTYTPVITANLNISDSPFEAPYMYGGGFYVSGTVTDPSGVETPSGGPGLPAGLHRVQPGVDHGRHRRLAGLPVLRRWVHLLRERPVQGGLHRIDRPQPVRRQLRRRRVGPHRGPGDPQGRLQEPQGHPDQGQRLARLRQKKIKVAKKVGNKWKKYKTFKTTSAGKYKFTLPAPRRGKTQWRITVPGDAQYTKWETKGYTYSSRMQAAPKVAFTR